jgi:DNA polymerase-3 subunit epsilon
MESIDSLPLAFVDVETTGASWARNYVTEIAIIRYENGKVVDSFTSFVRPLEPIPEFITSITGITNAMVADAPTFSEIAEDVRVMFDGALLVAHNAPFDYSFIRQEFKRLGERFSVKKVDTVRLSRQLYPHQDRHRLADLIRHHDFQFDNRHRAYDDTHVLVQFWDKIQQEFGTEAVHELVRQQLKAPKTPAHLTHIDVSSLPNTVGVYLFKDENDYPLYIGKSVRIRERVKSHFNQQSDEYKEFKISQTVKKVDYIETDGELAALLLESYLIKQYMPLYNMRLRRKSKLLAVRSSTNSDGYTELRLDELSTAEVTDYSDIVSIHQKRSLAKMTLNTLVSTFDLCPKLCGLEKTKGRCFLRQLGKCRGACEGAEPFATYNERLETAFRHRGIDEWSYAEPMVFWERATESTRTGFLVDNWIIQKIIRYEDGVVTEEPYNQGFDFDAYTILQSYLRLHPDRIEATPYRSLTDM